MDDKKKRILARQIRNDMTTQESGCYRLKKLPKTATINNIIKIIEAMSGESWNEVFNTLLYINDGSAYCNIIAHMHLKYKRELNI